MTRGTGTSPSAMAAQEKLAKALTLRRAGASYDAIARECGYRSKSAAHSAVSRHLERTAMPKEDVAALRDLEAERLDALQLAHWRDALGTQWRDEDGVLHMATPEQKVAATRSIMRVMERRAKLLGLDVPVEYVLRLESDQVDFMEAALRRVLAGVAGLLATNGGADLVDRLWETVEGEIVPRELAAAAGLATGGADAPHTVDEALPAQ